jgi:hypothetical protein
MRFILIILILVGCSSKKDKSSKDETVEKKENKSKFEFEIKQLNYLKFRRNYFYDEKTYQNKKLRDKLDNRNPEGMNVDTALLKKFDIGFKKLNLLDSNGNLKLKIWGKISKNKLETIKVNGLEYLLGLNYDNDYVYDIKIRKYDSMLVAKNNFKFQFPPDVTFYVYDLDNDKNDEIISMYHWYIINGDNYDFNVYEISKNFR